MNVLFTADDMYKLFKLLNVLFTADDHHVAMPPVLSHPNQFLSDVSIFNLFCHN